MSPKARRKPDAPVLVVNSEVLRRIRQHARSESKTEVCGVLIGDEENGKVRIDACISGVNAAQGGSHVTFTQDTWEHIYKIKDKEYPEARILGWYHSHPGFGVFLSDHDTFIHKNFFSSPQQVAWVYDPLSDEEGCFGWVNGRLERLSQLAVSDSRGGEEAGETGKPEPMMLETDQDQRGAFENLSRSRRDPEPAWQRWTVTILWNLSIFACGLIVAWYLFPRVVVMPVPVDPHTGRVIQEIPAPTDQRMDQQPQSPAGAQSSNDSASKQPDSANTREDGKPKQ